MNKLIFSKGKIRKYDSLGLVLLSIFIFSLFLVKNAEATKPILIGSSSDYIGLGVTDQWTRLKVSPFTDMEGVKILSSNWSPFVIRDSADTYDIFRVDQNGNITGAIGGNSTAWTKSGNNLYSTTLTDEVGIGTNDPTSRVEIAGGPLRLTGTYLDLNRVASASSGISWYSQAFNAWASYMASPGAGAGPKGNLTAPSGSIVTSWGLRSFIENVAGYGWTFESGTSGATTPAVKFEIRSSDGAFHSYGAGLIDGSVGIGTTNPRTKLEVTGNVRLPATGAKIMVGSGTPGSEDDYLLLQDVATGNSSFRWVQDNVTKFSIDGSTGDVGVGTATPGGYKLNVQGTGYFSQPVVVGTPTLSTHAATKGYVDSAVTSGNATLLDNIDSPRFIYGSNGSGSNGTSATQNVYELAQYKSGFWDSNGATWTPTADWYWGATFAHQSNSSSYNYAGQLAFRNGGGGNNVYARTISGGTPTPVWSRLLSDTSNVNSSGNLQISGAGPHYISSGNVGIGTVDSEAKFNVVNDIAAYNNIYGVKSVVSLYDYDNFSYNEIAGYFESNGASTGNSYGVYAKSSPNYGGDSIAVYGDSPAIGVMGRADSIGVYGNGANYGSYGYSSTGYGVFGNSSTGYGVMASSGSGFGIYANAPKNYFSGSVGIGTAASVGKLNIYESPGIAHSATQGSLTIDHGNSGGASSVVFRSTVNRSSDYGYIQYQDAATVAGAGESARLIIGTSNDTDDHIALMPTGNVGIGTLNPGGYKLDVAGNINASSGLCIGGNCRSSWSSGQNLLDTSSWTIGSGSIGAFAQNGATSENQRVWFTDPFNRPAMVWKGVSDAANDGSGGWNATVTINPNKSYRSMVWVMKPVTGAGSVYLGCDGGNTLNLNNTSNNNPYFFAFGAGTLTAGRWYLLVGYIHANNDSSTTNYSAMYDGVTGQKVLDGIDYKNGAGSTQVHRSYSYYDTTNGSVQYFWGPRFEEVNGSEPSIESILGNEKGSTKNSDTYFGGSVTMGAPYGTSPGRGRLMAQSVYGSGHPAIVAVGGDMQSTCASYSSNSVGLVACGEDYALTGVGNSYFTNKVGIGPGVDINNSTYNLEVGGGIGAATFTYTSDRSLKKNIATIKSPLTKILQLRGVTFNWKKDNSPSVGLIAQEVETVFPELVTQSNGIKSVQYGNLVAPLIEAVKEQQKEIDNLNGRIKVLEANK